MPQQFSTSILKLGSGIVTTTGNDIFVNSIKVGSSLSGWVVNTVSGGLQQQIFETGAASVAYANTASATVYGVVTGMSGQAVIDYATKTSLAATGQQAWTAADNNGINLSGNLTQTGATLYALISAASAGVSSLNGQSGILTITGTGSVAVIVNGSTFTISGIAGASATSADLTATGVTLGAKIDSVSGWVNNVVSGGLEVRITATGNSAVSHANGIGSIISGNLTQTGITLNSKIDSLSGFVGNVSGGLEARIQLTGQTAWTHGQNNALNLSGTIQSTGTSLQNQINAITAGTGAVLNNVVFTTGIQYIEGTKYFIGNTYIDNLFVTGTQTVINTQDLYIADNWMTLNATGGARDSAIFVSTGFTGASATGGVFGFDVPSNTWRFGIASQTTDLVTLPRVASGEAVDLVDSKVNSLSGFTVTVVSGGLETRIVATGNAAISHANGIGSIISGNLTQTGATLNNKINALSGFVGNVSGGLETRIFATGTAAVTHANGIGSIISGNLTQTGVALINRDLLVSGWLSTGLANTGSAAVNHANGIGFIISGNLTQTGIALMNRDLLVSGWLTTGLANTGSAAVNHANGIGAIISGNLTQTGVTLGSKIDNLSGFYTGSMLAYVTGIISGEDFVYINHLNHTFAGIPKVVVELELTNQATVYFHSVSGRSATGFYLLFSNRIEESGLLANVIAKL